MVLNYHHFFERKIAVGVKVKCDLKKNLAYGLYFSFRVTEKELQITKIRLLKLFQKNLFAVKHYYNRKYILCIIYFTFSLIYMTHPKKN